MAMPFTVQLVRRIGRKGYRSPLYRQVVCTIEISTSNPCLVLQTRVFPGYTLHDYTLQVTSALAVRYTEYGHLLWTWTVQDPNACYSHCPVKSLERKAQIQARLQQIDQQIQTLQNEQQLLLNQQPFVHESCDFWAIVQRLPTCLQGIIFSYLSTSEDLR